MLSYIGSTYGNSYSAPSSSNDSDRLNGTSASNVSASNNQKLDRIHLDDFVSDPTRLNKYSPEQIYSFLKNNGYEVSPLTQSATLKGLPFEQGGGFKVLWGGDKLLQYHPATGSHHGGAYYKVSSGTYGTTRIPIE